MAHIEPLTSEQLRELTHNALSLWHKGNADGNPLGDLLLYHQAYDHHKSVRGATNAVLRRSIAHLEKQLPEEATILQLRFDQELSAQMVATRLSMSEGNVFKKQREAIEHLADILLSLEETARAERQSDYTRRIEPATYTTLFGVGAALTSLVDVLAKAEPPWLISIEGIGGIGKTTIAHALVSALVAEGIVGWRHYCDLAWVKAQRQFVNAGGALRNLAHPALPVEELIIALAEQLLPDDERSGQGLKALERKLSGRFKESPHLVVIDNLETEADIFALLEPLHRWANPSKFLLTSRRSLFDQPGVYPYRLLELDQADSLALVRHEARLRNLPSLADATDAQLDPIYRTVGGNPLALRLVVGQTFVHSLDHVLADLRGAQGGAAEQLYTHIYRCAWERLDEAARQVLLIMPLVNEAGAELDFLAAIAAQEAQELRPALERLVTLNLVDSQGDLSNRLYSIHSLTRSFLHEQVLHWNS
jgi:hypothetical protein